MCVARRAHALTVCAGRVWHAARLHYAAGDAVIFDAKLLHRGLGAAAGNYQHDVRTLRRIGLSFTFGR